MVLSEHGKEKYKQYREMGYSHEEAFEKTGESIAIGKKDPIARQAREAWYGKNKNN